MNADRLFRIANRIHLLLLRELGQGVDVKRMLTEPLYARDILLVCEAMPGSDLDSLAKHFRAGTVAGGDETGLPSIFGPDSSGFGPSRPAATDSEMPDLPLAGTQANTRRWLSRARSTLR